MSKTILLSSVIIPDNRQRQEFEAQGMEELRQSIEDRGLMHAPVLREYLDEFILVAGERRIKAMQDMWELGELVLFDGVVIPEGRIPYVTLGELTVLEAEEAELDENLRRRDLTWQEHAAAVQKLHALRQAQVVVKNEAILLSGGTPLPVHTVADTALEVRGRADGSYQDSVRKEILVAKYLSNPEVAKAKNVDEAFKILKRQEEGKRNIALAETVGLTFTADVHELHNMSCLEWMGRSESVGKFDVILTDPPYGMGADQFGDASGKLTGIQHHYDDSYESWVTLMEQWSRLSYIVAKPQAHAYVFCDIDNFHELKTMMQDAGWYVFRTPMIFYKTNSGRVPLPDRGPRRQYETLLYAIKGQKPVTHIYPDVIPSVGDENMSHGAQKPVAVYQNLLQRSIRPGDVVLDSFAGSGTIFPACHELKCKAVGIELNPEYYGMSMTRINLMKGLPK